VLFLGAAAVITLALVPSGYRVSQSAPSSPMSSVAPPKSVRCPFGPPRSRESQRIVFGRNLPRRRVGATM
jgi:hypothetical protein